MKNMNTKLNNQKHKKLNQQKNYKQHNKGNKMLNRN